MTKFSDIYIIGEAMAKAMNTAVQETVRSGNDEAEGKKIVASCAEFVIAMATRWGHGMVEDAMERKIVSLGPQKTLGKLTLEVLLAIFRDFAGVGGVGEIVKLHQRRLQSLATKMRESAEVEEVEEDEAEMFKAGASWGDLVMGEEVKGKNE